MLNKFFIQRWSKWSWWAWLLLLVGTPLHALLASLLLYQWGLSELLAFRVLIMGWKELLIGLLFVGALAYLWLKKPKMNEWQKALHLVIPAFMLLGLVATVFSSSWESPLDLVKRLVYGGRTEFAFLMALFSISVASLSWTKEQKAKLLKVALWLAGFILIFGFFLMIVGHEWLTNFGYRPVWSTFEVGKAPAFCQREGGDGFCRLQSVFTGPNRYGAYLLTALPLFWVSFKQKHWSIFLIAAALVSLYLTNSMSAWIAAIVMAIVALLYPFRSVFYKYQKWFLLGAGLLFAGALFAVTQMNEGFFFGDNSNMVRFVYMQKAVNSFLQNPFGEGLAVAGPASFRVGEQFIPESWWFQVMVNMGIFGLLLFVAIWLILLNWKKDSRWVWMLVIGLLVQNLFLHTFEEAGVYVLWSTLLLLL